MPHSHGAMGAYRSLLALSFWSLAGGGGGAAAYHPRHEFLQLVGSQRDDAPQRATRSPEAGLRAARRGSWRAPRPRTRLSRQHQPDLVSTRKLPSPLYKRIDELKDAQEAFVVVKSSAERISVEIAGPEDVTAIFLMIYVPVGVCWAAVLYHGTWAKHSMILLPLSFVATTIAFDVANESLSALMGAPMSITAFQALGLMLVTGIWVLVKELVYPFMSHEVLQSLWKWTLVAVLFALYQLVNHLVSLYCSLSERAVFYSITPLAMVVAEHLFLPHGIKGHVSFNSKLAMSGMLLGAGLFASQYPDFTGVGVLSAIGMVAAVVPYRFFQRWNLAECIVAPLAVLGCYDGMVLFVPSFVLADVGLDTFWEDCRDWLADPSVAILMAQSVFAFTLGHILALALLRESSATALLVFYSVANGIILILGAIFFGDDIFGAFTFTGIVLILVCGLWYSVDLYMASQQPAAAACEAALYQGKGDDLPK